MKNSAQGKIFYGMHFYPGTALYQEPDKDSLMVFLNEDTIRSMDPTFAGCPVYVHHVDEVSDNREQVKREQDGVVVESFFNKSDGKHWVKFITLTDKAEKAISSGWRLSNCYIPKSYGNAGVWNGMEYNKEIRSAEYEHLAIVPDPRYDESIIMTPEEFKQYNQSKEDELRRLANNKGAKSMLNFFKRQKVENALDIENTLVELPKSKLEVSIKKLINDADEMEVHKADPMEANPDHHVKLKDGIMMKVGDMAKKYEDCMNELESMKKDHEDADAKEMNDGEEEDGMSNEDVEHPEDDEDAKKKALQLAEHEDKEIEEAKHKNAIDEKAKAKAKAERLRNADKEHDKKQNAIDPQEFTFTLASDQVAEGKRLFGSK